ncbi:MAG: AAC(3) family N-acetyltransferase [Bacillus subtilis]|nr:AAC(3) family N-acetyltransferase [Bacillus subtilis]
MRARFACPPHSGHLSDPAQWENPPVPAAWVPVIYETMPVFDPQLTECWGIGTLPERFRLCPESCVASTRKIRLAPPECTQWQSRSRSR